MINVAAQVLITESERIVLVAYLCPAGVPTIGRGHTKGITRQMVRDRYTITVAQEQIMFEQDMAEWERGVLALLKRVPNENQLGAMVSLTFNIGLAAFAKSSVLKAFERGDDIAAAKAFGLWNKMTHPVTKKLVIAEGLVIRRAKESALYLTNPIKARAAEPMPQAVGPPKTMAQSTINRASIIAGATTTVVTITEGFNTVSGLKTSVSGLGNWFVPTMLVIALLAIAYIIWERNNQRNSGLA